MADDQQISWMTLEKGVRITTSDGAELGKVDEVVADRQKDIFSGITFSGGMLSDDRFVPADLIDRMTAEEVTLTVTAAEAEEKIQPYEG